jgi:hypothetical protein
LRILLDENLDWRLRQELPGHNVESVPLLGWAGVTNGELLSRASGSFDVFITMDAGIPHQRNLAKHNLVVILLRAPSNRLVDTKPLMAKVLRLLESAPSASVKTISL